MHCVLSPMPSEGPFSSRRHQLRDGSTYEKQGYDSVFLIMLKRYLDWAIRAHSVDTPSLFPIVCREGEHTENRSRQKWKPQRVRGLTPPVSEEAILVSWAVGHDQCEHKRVKEWPCPPSPSLAFENDHPAFGPMGRKHRKVGETSWVGFPLSPQEFRGRKGKRGGVREETNEQR